MLRRSKRRRTTEWQQGEQVLWEDTDGRGSGLVQPPAARMDVSQVGGQVDLTMDSDSDESTRKEDDRRMGAAESSSSGTDKVFARGTLVLTPFGCGSVQRIYPAGSPLLPAQPQPSAKRLASSQVEVLTIELCPPFQYLAQLQLAAKGACITVRERSGKQVFDVDAPPHTLLPGDTIVSVDDRAFTSNQQAKAGLKVLASLEQGVKTKTADTLVLSVERNESSVDVTLEEPFDSVKLSLHAQGTKILVSLNEGFDQGDCAGLKPGDVVVSVNGSRFPNVRKAQAATEKILCFRPEDQGELDGAVDKQGDAQHSVRVQVERERPVAVEADIERSINTNADTRAVAVYEVWLQWGDGGYQRSISEHRKRQEELLNRKQRKRGSPAATDDTFDMCWMPRAFLPADQLKLASDVTAFRFRTARIFGGYSERNRIIEVSAGDVCRAWPGVHLNDTVIDFWIAQTIDKMSPEALDRIYIFNSLFFNWLSGSSQRTNFQQAYEEVRSITKSVDIFSKEVLFVPINDGLHWTLAVVCNPGLLLSAVKHCAENVAVISLEESEATSTMQSSENEMDVENSNSSPAELEDTHAEEPRRLRPRQPSPRAPRRNQAKPKAREEQEQDPFPGPFVLFLDSLRGANRSSKVMQLLRSYLEAEWRARKGDELGSSKVSARAVVGFSPNVPEQKNNCDCGVFMLEFFERLVQEDARQLHEYREKATSLGYREAKKAFEQSFGGPKWFAPVDVAEKRLQLLDSMRRHSYQLEG